MKIYLVLLFYYIISDCVDFSLQSPKNNKELDVDSYQYLPPQINAEFHHSPPTVTLLPPLLQLQNKELETVANHNPLLAALLLTSSLGVPQKAEGFNHPQHLPVNPYIALFLSHYGRYVPTHGRKHGIYGYTAANNLHNNKPFGSYKIYEDTYN